MSGWRGFGKSMVAPALACLAGGALAVAGCSGAVEGDGVGEGGQSGVEAVEYGELARPIKGGMVDKKTKSIVGIWIHHGDGKKGVCSGTLIAPNLVLTARHCVNDVNADPGNPCGKIRFSTPRKRYRVTTNTRMHGQATYYEDAEVYRPAGDKFCGRDIALIRLKKSIPASEATPAAPRLKNKVQVGQPYAAIGFGRDGSNGGTGVRRRMDNLSIQCLGKPCGPSRITDEEFMGDGPACHGDSGSGAIAPDGTVFGVTSRAGKGCAWTMFSSVYAWRSFIQTSAVDAAKYGGYPAPVWTNAGPDGDGDGWADGWDNCPKTANKTQDDLDGDGKGDGCDDDIDGDGVGRDTDNCPMTKNKPQRDTDMDGEGDRCDSDLDGDGHENDFDNCPNTPNPEQAITDGDGTGDACDDSDGDGLVDAEDNCPENANREQTDSDGDDIGDVCDETPLPDADGDGVGDPKDNCPMKVNSQQTDSDGDGTGDVCDETPKPDADGDGVADGEDNCPMEANGDQADADEDGLGDVCDETPRADAGGSGDAGGVGESGDAGGVGESGDAGAASGPDAGSRDQEILMVDEPEEGGCSTAGGGAPLPAMVMLGLLAGLPLLSRSRRRRE